MRHSLYTQIYSRGMTEKPQVPAARNVLRILTLLASTDTPISARRIMHELDLPRSTTYHLLRELEDSGYVVHLDHPSTYGLGLAAYQMSQAYTTQQPLVRMAAKSLEKIAAMAGGSTHLSRLAGTEVLYLHEARAPGAVSLVTVKGVRLPALRTASGRAMLAHLPESELRAIFATSENRPLYKDLQEQLEQVRERGWSTEIEEVARGQESIAVAVLDHLQRPAAAVAVTFPLCNDDAKKQQLVDALKETAKVLKQKFFDKR